MPEKKLRQANARAAATKYAPRPDGSTLTYGLIAVSLLALGLALYGGFYAVDMFNQPIPLVLAGLGAFGFGAALRFRRQRREGGRTGRSLLHAASAGRGAMIPALRRSRYGQSSCFRQWPSDRS